MFSLDIRDTEDALLHAHPTRSTTPHSTYDPNLVKHLKADHVTLQATLARLEDHAHHRPFTKIPAALARFRVDLLRHIEEEDAHFYAYVERALHDDPLVSERLARAHARMAGIARMVALFVRHYSDIGVTSTTRDAFLRDLDVIAALLGDRIALEETSLYALYQPPHRAGELPDEDYLLGLESSST
jgi:hypothetical protein